MSTSDPPKRSSDSPSSQSRRSRDAQGGVRFEQVDRSGGSAASGNDKLPPTIEVDKFAQARMFEIQSLHAAMRAAKEAGAQRAFQSLPRALRRRAASHNIRRLPMRLRAKAKSETPKDAAKPKKVSRSLLGKKSKRIGPNAERFAARQRSKLWLETHVWHAKRMHMVDIWGHRIAHRPTAKAFRASYRASVHGALVHDASYFQYLEITGPEDELCVLLVKIADDTMPSPTGKRFILGQRECETNLYAPSATHRALLGPTTIIWDTPSTDRAPSPSTSSSSPERQVLLRLHPALARSAWDAVQSAKSLLWPSGNLSTMPRKLEKELLTFEVTGRRATQVVKSVLRPVIATDKGTKEAWRKLCAEKGPECVPRGMILGVEVYDPRLSFPPKLNATAAPLRPDELLVPSADVAAITRFWDKDARRPRTGTPRYRKFELDARRNKQLIPGTALVPQEDDDRIPLLLSQRTLSSSTCSGRSLFGWTITLPAQWGQAFFSSLVFASPRVAGLLAREQQAFESGTPHFPKDFVGTKANEEWEVRREVQDRGFWERRPPAKRPNYAKLGGGLEHVWTVSGAMRALVARWSGAGKEEGELWVAPSKSVREMEDALARGSPAEQVAKDLAGDRARTALVRVRVDMVGRGKVEDLGVIYWLEDGEREQVEQAVVAGRVKEARATGELAPDEISLQPSKTNICGRVTSGGFSLSLGRPAAIAVVNLTAWLRIVERDGQPWRDQKPDEVVRGVVLVRNRDGEVFRAARLSLLE